MVLTDEQADRFFDTMDALLFYVNNRFQVVEGFTLDYDGQLGDMKASLVAQALWENVEIIDEFVRDNPLGLPQRCLQTALGWKNALPGLYTVIRYQSGQALMMNEANVFSVGGITFEIVEEIGEVPALAETVLLPFDDGIVYDGFLQAYDLVNDAGEIARIQDEFENRCAKGIVSTAREFIRIAGAHLAEERDKDIEALLADVSREVSDVTEVLPKGFHRGALAGLDTLEREAAITKATMNDDGDVDFDLIFAALAEIGATERKRVDIQNDQAVNCAVASVIERGLISLDELYDQYCALVPEPLTRGDFDLLMRQEMSYPDAYFGLWNYQSVDYLAYYTLLPDYVTRTASRDGSWRKLREQLDYYENYKRELLLIRSEVAPKPLSRTLMENTPFSELLGDPNVVRLRCFLDERIPDGQNDYTFADMAVQEFVLTSIETGSLEDLYQLSFDLGLDGCTADDSLFIRLMTNVFNAMPSWENNGWSPQELYEQLTGRRMFHNDDGTVKKIGADEPCPCGSGLKYRQCCGK